MERNNKIPYSLCYLVQIGEDQVFGGALPGASFRLVETTNKADSTSGNFSGFFLKGNSVLALLCLVPGGAKGISEGFKDPCFV